MSLGCTQRENKDDWNDLLLQEAIKEKLATQWPSKVEMASLEHPFCFITDAWFTWWVCWGVYGHAHRTKTDGLHDKGGEEHGLALTTHLRPMNFAQIWFSPTDSLNGKSMGARDSTSLKDNVSKRQLLGFDLPHQICSESNKHGLSGMQGETAWQGPPGPRNPLPLSLCLWLSIFFVHASSADPALLTLFKAEPC